MGSNNFQTYLATMRNAWSVGGLRSSDIDVATARPTIVGPHLSFEQWIARHKAASTHDTSVRQPR